MSQKSATNPGFLLAVIAFICWGLSPLLWHQVEFISPLELMAHRGAWSALFALTLLYFFKKTPALILTLKNRKLMLSIAVSSVLLFFNWYIYVKGVQEHQVAEMSFGYFVCPFLNMVLAYFIFDEKFSKQKRIGAIFILLAVLLRMSNLENFPWYAVGVAVTFSVYATIRKKFAIDGLVAMTLETAIIGIVMLGFFIPFSTFMEHVLTVSQGHMPGFVAMICVLTMVPFALYLLALSRISFNDIAYLNYVTPSVKLLVAVFALNETIHEIEIASFALVWIGLMITFVPMRFLRALPVKL